MWKHVSDASKRKEKQHWIIEKSKLDNARQIRCIFFIEPDDEEFKHTMKNASRKLQIPMPAAMPWKTSENAAGKPAAVLGNTKPKMCLYSRCLRIYENTIGRDTTKVSWRSHRWGVNSLSHYNLAHKFIPMHQGFFKRKKPDAKAAGEKDWEKLKKDTGMAGWQETETRKR